MKYKLKWSVKASIAVIKFLHFALLYTFKAKSDLKLKCVPIGIAFLFSFLYQIMHKIICNNLKLGYQIKDLLSH